MSSVDSEHSLLALRGMHELWTSGRFLDVTLSCEDGSLRAHRLVLAATSSYFRQHLTSDVQEIRVPSLLRHLETVLLFMYTGYARMKAADLMAVTTLATTLGVQGLAITPAEETPDVAPDPLAVAETADFEEPPRPPVLHPPDGSNLEVENELTLSDTATGATMDTIPPDEPSERTPVPIGDLTTGNKRSAVDSVAATPAKVAMLSTSNDKTRINVPSQSLEQSVPVPLANPSQLQLLQLLQSTTTQLRQMPSTSSQTEGQLSQAQSESQLSFTPPLTVQNTQSRKAQPAALLPLKIEPAQPATPTPEAPTSMPQEFEAGRVESEYLRSISRGIAVPTQSESQSPTPEIQQPLVQLQPAEEPTWVLQTEDPFKGEIDVKDESLRDVGEEGASTLDTVLSSPTCEAPPLSAPEPPLDSEQSGLSSTPAATFTSAEPAVVEPTRSVITALTKTRRPDSPAKQLSPVHSGNQQQVAHSSKPRKRVQGSTTSQKSKATPHLGDLFPAEVQQTSRCDVNEPASLPPLQGPSTQPLNTTSVRQTLSPLPQHPAPHQDSVVNKQPTRAPSARLIKQAQTAGLPKPKQTPKLSLSVIQHSPKLNAKFSKFKQLLSQMRKSD